MKNLSILLFFALLLGGCSSGPDSAELERSLQARLDESFKDLFTIEDFDQRGHYDFDAPAADGNRERVLIYFDTKLRFMRDDTLTHWNQVNVGSLITILGATPLGVRGVTPTGNQKGDILEVHGSIAFKASGDTWVVVHDAPAVKAEATRKEDAQSPYRQHLATLSVLGKALQESDAKADMKALEQSLAGLVGEASRRLARSKGKISFATGSPGGEYHAQGVGLARILSDTNTPAEAFPTHGSLQNSRLVASGEVRFAYVQNDIAQMAHSGSGLFSGEPPKTNLRAICALYPEAVQIVTLAGSKIKTVADLANTRIDIGPAGSGVRVNALQVLSAAGLKLEDIKATQGRPLGDALKDLTAGTIDALFITSAYPTPAITKTAATYPLALVPLDEGTLANLASRSQLVPMRVPSKTYPGVDVPTKTAGVVATLVTTKGTPDVMVTTVLKQLFGNVEKLSRGSLQANYISPSQARTGLSIPLHPAAETHLKAFTP
jgi:hypothetical protein